MAGRGGKREGSGRKRDPLKDLRTGTSTALKILKELDDEKQVVEIYENCGDYRLKTHIIFKLREWGYGKPGQQEPDTRDTTRELDFGDLPMPASGVAGATGKPN